MSPTVGLFPVLTDSGHFPVCHWNHQDVQVPYESGEAQTEASSELQDGLQYIPHRGSLVLLLLLVLRK